MRYRWPDFLDLDAFVWFPRERRAFAYEYKTSVVPTGAERSEAEWRDLFM